MRDEQETHGELFIFAVIQTDHGETSESKNKRKPWATQDTHPGRT